MEHLKSRNLANAVIDSIKAGKPYLGICLGMQMLLEESEEAPGVKGLGVYKGKVVRFPDGTEKVPHMGWNSISIKKENPNLKDVPDESYFYFVHSFYAKPEDNEITIASCKYILEFAAAIGKNNVFATQFHPEKSQNKGISILTNFVRSAENGQ
jgi:glutamine amidotransferase